MFTATLSSANRSVRATKLKVELVVGSALACSGLKIRLLCAEGVISGIRYWIEGRITSDKLFEGKACPRQPVIAVVEYSDSMSDYC